MGGDAEYGMVGALAKMPMEQWTSEADSGEHNCHQIREIFKNLVGNANPQRRTLITNHVMVAGIGNPTAIQFNREYVAEEVTSFAVNPHLIGNDQKEARKM